MSLEDTIEGKIVDPDADLIAKAKAGNELAFEELLGRNAGRCRHVIERKLRKGMKNIDYRAITDEVYQEVSIALYKALDRFRCDSRFSTYAYITAVNHTKNKIRFLKRRKAHMHVSMYRPDDLEMNWNDPIPPEQHYQADQEKNILMGDYRELCRTVLDSIPEKYRMVLELRMTDMGYEEISGTLGLPLGTVKSRIHRARTHLARYLTVMEIEEQKELLAAK